MKNNYDNIAVVYDFLSRLVFGKAQVHLQMDLLKHILPNSRMLIVGGGSGWILEKLAQQYPQGLEITYVEISAKMLNLSRKRNCGHHKVTFIHSAIEDFHIEEAFDFIMTAFLFDNFSESRASLVFEALHAKLKLSGCWLFADFSMLHAKNIFWKKILLKLMYAFFKCLCNVEANRLVNMEKYFYLYHYEMVVYYVRYAGFMKSAVYKKTNRN